MRKKITLLTLMLASQFINSQVGINTTTPESTLDVRAVNHNGAVTAKDGLLTPRVNDLTANGSQNGQLVYLIENNVSYLKGFYYWDGIAWVAIVSNVNIGDIKHGFQNSDHKGWVKLNGRAISTLSSTQQDNAKNLGFSINLPNAKDVYFSQNETSLGSITNTNTKYLAQNNLPNVTLGGSTNTTGSHSHGVNSGESGGGNMSYNDAGASNGSRKFLLNTTNAGAHSHSITTSSINGGVSQVPIDVRPATMSVNCFVFLGD
ncbi:hypothetical protein [Flavobacterium sp.]|uniref:hypothetical protein n=1 Tax=Flavobacterium sp. TaxID=239 RepID=UPI0040474D40